MICLKGPVGLHQEISDYLRRFQKSKRDSKSFPSTLFSFQPNNHFSDPQHPRVKPITIGRHAFGDQVRPTDYRLLGFEYRSTDYVPVNFNLCTRRWQARHDAECI